MEYAIVEVTQIDCGMVVSTLLQFDFAYVGWQLFVEGVVYREGLVAKLCA